MLPAQLDVTQVILLPATIVAVGLYMARTSDIDTKRIEDALKADAQRFEDTLKANAQRIDEDTLKANDERLEANIGAVWANISAVQVSTDAQIDAFKASSDAQISAIAKVIEAYTAIIDRLTAAERREN